MFDRYGSMINTIASVVVAVMAVLTFVVLLIAGIFWLGELNSDVERNQQAIVEVNQELKGVRNELKQDIEDVRNELKQDIEDVRNELKHEISSTRQEILKEIENTNREIKESNQRILDALANHTHDEDGNAIFTRPVAE